MFILTYIGNIMYVLNMSDMSFAWWCEWSFKSYEMWHCCASGSWCFGELDFLFIRRSIETEGTLGLPDSENESSTSGFTSEHLSFLSLLITPIHHWAKQWPAPKRTKKVCDVPRIQTFETYASSAALGTKPTTLPTDQW